MARSSHDYICSFAFGSPAYDASIHLRYLILRKPLNLEFEPVDLKMEWDSLHLGYFDSLDNLLGCLVLQPVSETIWKMRQVAVSERRQGEGIGHQLVLEAEHRALQNGISTISLHARFTAIAFYQNRGYTIQSEPFQEVGIPHVKMSKALLSRQ